MQIHNQTLTNNALTQTPTLIACPTPRLHLIPQNLQIIIPPPIIRPWGLIEKYAIYTKLLSQQPWPLRIRPDVQHDILYRFIGIICGDISERSNVWVRTQFGYLDQIGWLWERADAGAGTWVEDDGYVEMGVVSCAGGGRVVSRVAMHLQTCGKRTPNTMDPILPAMDTRIVGKVSTCQLTMPQPTHARFRGRLRTKSRAKQISQHFGSARQF